jgi:hypothetical protein
LLSAVLSGLALVACSSSEPKRFDTDLPLPLPEDAPVVKEATDLDRLNEIIATEKSWKTVTADLVLIVKAEAATKKGNVSEAQKNWIEALKIAPGKIGIYAFDKYVDSVVAQLGTNPALEKVVAKVSAGTKGGKLSRYMTENGVGNDQAIKEFVVKKYPSLSTGTEKIYLVNIPDPPSERIPVKDPVLKATVKSYCSAREKIKISTKKDVWERWILNLGPGLTKYFEAAVADCLSSAQMAAQFYQEAVDLFKGRPEFDTFTVLAYERITYLQRITGRRSEAAEAYKKLVWFLETNVIRYSDLGDSKPAFEQRKINHILWASRYQALVSDYNEAHRYAAKAINLVKVNLATKQSKKDYDLFNEYLAEAYHVLAFRVAIEKSEFKEAYAWAIKGSEIPDLNAEWRERFWWYIGFYPYLENNYALAIASWEKALPRLEKQSSRKSQFLFWLAHAYKQQKNEDKSKEYLEILTEEFPLEYYSLIAIEEGGFSPEENLVAQTKAFAADGPYELSEREFDLDPHYDNKEGNRKLVRAQILVAARIPHLGKLAIDELAAHIKGAHKIRDKDNLDIYVYLSRLHYHNGGFREGILLTYEMSTIFKEEFWEMYPDQMRVYFPAPYEKVYNENSAKTGVPKEVLYAITRQESSFQHDAESPAGAVGLMQLIPPTAKKYLPTGLSATDIRQKLKEPALNVDVASLYLRDLQDRYEKNEGAIFGAYNAGEYVVDMWLKKRNFQDNLVWVELIPFSETKDYVMKVRRNARIYRILGRGVGGSKAVSVQEGGRSATH